MLLEGFKQIPISLILESTLSPESASKSGIRIGETPNFSFISASPNITSFFEIKIKIRKSPCAHLL